jgi:hypothetical protein
MSSNSRTPMETPPALAREVNDIAEACTRTIAIVAATDPDSKSVLTWLVNSGRFGRSRSILPVEIIE